jgi:hypothetical protein
MAGCSCISFMPPPLPRCQENPAQSAPGKRQAVALYKSLGYQFGQEEGEQLVGCLELGR